MNAHNMYNNNYILLLIMISSTDEDPGLRIESFAVINLRGVSTNKKYYMFYQELIEVG